MKYKVRDADSAPSGGVCPPVSRWRLFFPADGHEREAVAGLQQTGPGVSEPAHR